MNRIKKQKHRVVMNKIGKIFVVGVLLMLGGLTKGSAFNLSSLSTLPSSSNITLPRDTDEVEDNPFVVKNLKKRIPVDSAKMKGFKDYAEYIMDKRDRGINEDYHKHWYDNLFVQLGAGAEQIIPLSENYSFDPMTTVHFAAGIQLGKYHSFRLKAHGGLGYQKYYDRMYGRLGFKVDHVFDLSSFLDGYQPTRLLGIGTVLGFGVQKAKLNNYNGKWGNAIEGHGGLQFRFYTGSNAYLNIEPYVGLASDQIDLSEEKNWRQFDVLYGVNFNFVYYFKNHLSRQARIRQIEEARKNGKDNWVMYKDVIIDYDSIQKKAVPGRDSILQSWQKPWFIEMAFGPTFQQMEGVGFSESMGSSVSLSVGKWLSPLIGLRFSASSRNSTWIKETKSVNTDGGGVKYEKKQNMQYFSVGAEALFNPLGFFRNRFTWDAKYGVYLLAGGEYGWMKRDKDGATHHCRSEAYDAGLHLWYRLSEGTQIFIEPRFTHNVYKIPYSNVHWNKRFSDNCYSIRIGLTAHSVARSFRQKDTAAVAEKWRPLAVSIGVGTNVVQKHEAISTDKASLPYNLNASVIYRFNNFLGHRVSGIRLGFQYLSLPASVLTTYRDYNMGVPGYAPVKHQGIWNHNYHMGIVSLNYVLNVTNAMAGYRSGRLFSLEAFFGPSVAHTFGETGDLDERFPVYVGHEVRLANKIKSKSYPAVSGGAMLSARLSQHLGLTFTPQIHMIPTLTLPGLLGGYPRYIETFDLGVYYKF